MVTIREGCRGNEQPLLRVEPSGLVKRPESVRNHLMNETEITPLSDVFDDLDEDAAALDPVRLYLNSIGKVPLLNAAQEVELAQRIEAGLYAQHKLDSPRGRRLAERTRTDLARLAAD